MKLSHTEMNSIAGLIVQTEEGYDPQVVIEKIELVDESSGELGSIVHEGEGRYMFEAGA